MTEQKRDYRPDNQSALFVVNKRFFDRPVEVKSMLKKAIDHKIWPSEGETVRILNRLAVLEDVFWEKRYQPLSTLQKYITEAYELSVELTSIEAELNGKGKKAPAICATVSFTGLVNIFVISVTTRQLVVTQPWKNEAESVRLALELAELEENPTEESLPELAIAHMVIDDEGVLNCEETLPEKGSTESVEGLKNVRIAKDKAKKLKKRFEGDNPVNRNPDESRVEKMEIELKMAEKRFDKTIESLDSQMIQIRVDLEDEVRTKNQKMANILKCLEEFGDQVESLRKKVTKNFGEEKVSVGEKALQASTNMSQATKMSLRGTLPEKVVKDKTLLSAKCRPEKSGEGDKVVVIRKSVTKVVGKRKVIAEAKDTRIVYGPGTSKSGEIEGVKSVRSSSSSTISVPDLEKLDSQRVHMNVSNVSDDSICLGIDEELSEFEIEHLQNAALEKAKLESAEAAVRAEEIELENKVNKQTALQIGLDKMKITRKSFHKKKREERAEKRKGLPNQKEMIRVPGSKVKDRLGEVKIRSRKQKKN